MKETLKERRLIEAGFPCHQVGAETQRERDTGKAPPTHRLHVWWARRPLTPSRAAVLASILPADTDPEWFLKELGIEVAQVDINGVPFVLDEKLQERIVFTGGTEKIEVDDVFLRALRNETETRANQRVSMRKMLDEDQSLLELEVFKKWDRSTQEFQQPLPEKGCFLPVKRTAADPAWFKELLQVASSKNVRVPNLYGYTRAYQHCPQFLPVVYNVMDLTAGGGSIPFEALRLGAQTIANELNPVASVILHATLEYPARYGIVLLPEIEHWGNRLLQNVESKMDQVFPRKFRINDDQLRCLEKNLKDVDSSRFEEFSYEDTMTYLYTRQVTCPHCGGEAPLLNTCWLSKSDGDQWGVAVVTDGKPQNGTVRFRTYRVSKGRVKTLTCQLLRKAKASVSIAGRASMPKRSSARPAGSRPLGNGRIVSTPWRPCGTSRNSTRTGASRGIKQGTKQDR
jgi:adenine-specific DNA methylase